MLYLMLQMDFKQFAQTQKANLPPLLANGDRFASISKLETHMIDYQGKPTEVGVVTTDKGLYGTFSGVIIKTLRVYFEKNTEPLTNVQVVIPRGKRYLSLEGF